MQRILSYLIMILITSTLLAQTEWVKYDGNPVMTVGSNGSWDDDYLLYPCVIYNGSEYEMWYAGDNGSGSDQIGHATSDDGIDWVKDDDNPALTGSPGEWDATGVQASSILFDGSSYQMWYHGIDAGDVHGIGYATSYDGVIWVKYSNNPVMVLSQTWEGNEVITGPSVLFDGTTYEMWYFANLNNLGIGYATYDDGINWNKYENNPVFTGTPGEWDLFAVKPEVIFANNLYHMWYTGATQASPASGTWHKGYATSDDGINWTRYADNPVLMCGPEAYDSLGIWESSAIYEDGVFHLWYAGRPSSNSTINYATSSTVSVKNTDIVNPNQFQLYQNYPNPFNPTTSIRYELPVESNVRLTVFDIHGRQITILSNRVQPAGNYTAQWNGIDISGNLVSTGMYICRFQAGSHSKTIKMVYLK